MTCHLKKLAAALLSMLTIVAAPACGERDSNELTVDEGLSPTSPSLVYARGWGGLSIDANSAKTVVDISGHYSIDRNMCQRRGDGVFSVELWNSLSDTVNQAIIPPPIATARCAASATSSKLYNRGIVEVTLKSPDGATTSKRQLFEYKNGDICTTIADPGLADKLLGMIEKTIVLADLADATDCPNYRP